MEKNVYNVINIVQDDNSYIPANGTAKKNIDIDWKTDDKKYNLYYCAWTSQPSSISTSTVSDENLEKTISLESIKTEGEE